MPGGARKGAGRPRKLDKPVYKTVTVRLLPLSVRALMGQMRRGESMTGCATRILCERLLDIVEGAK